MRQLLIIRHAIAHERNAALWKNDELRPLTARGNRNFRRTARRVADLFDCPDELLTGSLKRARQTARILREEAGFPKPAQFPALKPRMPAAALIAALRKRRGERLAIVGHEPQLSVLVSELLAGSRSKVNCPLKKGGIVLLQFSDAIAAGRGELLLFAPPRVFRD